MVAERRLVSARRAAPVQRAARRSLRHLGQDALRPAARSCEADGVVTRTAGTSAASESATWVGRGSAASASARVVPPVSTRARVEAGAAGAGDVDVEPVADRERAARAEAVAGGRVHRRLGLADDPRGADAGRGLDRRQDGAGARPLAVRHREARVARGADQLGAAQHGLGRDLAARRRTRSSWAATTTTSARVANGVLLTIRSPASATWSTSAWEPTT